MNYLYYPGCSLKGTGKAYDESMRAVFKALDVTCDEVNDWNCCGATAYMSINQNQAHALAARNLALAERQGANGKIAEVLTPCNACYLVLSKAMRKLENDALGERRILNALHSVGLEYNGKVRVRHPLDVLLNDIGLETIQANVQRKLDGVTAACYYGCQVVRPYAEFDDAHDPMSMDRLCQAVGAQTLRWPLKVRCCGGSLMGTVQDVGMRLSYILLKEAKRRGADVILTACPLCQFNLECYQREMSGAYGEIEIPVMYFTQFLGIALGLPEKELGLQRNFVAFRAPEPQPVDA